MKLLTTLVVCFFTFIQYSYAQKQLQFFQTNWGNQLSWDAFCERAKKSGYDGIEVWLPSEPKSQEELKKALDKYGLSIIFLNGTNKSLPFEKSLDAFVKQLSVLKKWHPALINCHTGSDFFTVEQNKKFIDAANKFAKENHIKVYHETHRSRFSYSLPQTLKYIHLIPDLKLNLDISHWMVVHESLLQGKDKELQEVIDRTYHIHARVGFPEGPQVNDPEAPEWKSALNRHLDIWEKIIRKRWSEGQDMFTITTEFGPPDYMPTLPYTRVPVADQWKANVFIMNAIKERLNIE